MLDDLAIVIAKGFESVDRRFENVDKRLDSVENRLTSVEKKIDDMDYRLAQIENSHSRRLDLVEDKILIPSTTIEKHLKIKLPK